MRGKHIARKTDVGFGPAGYHYLVSYHGVAVFIEAKLGKKSGVFLTIDFAYKYFGLLRGNKVGHQPVV